MKKVNKIRGQWVPRGIPAQPEGHQEIISESGNIHNKKPLSQVVFAAAIMIPGLSFFYLFNNISSTAFWGLAIMAGTLATKMCIESAMTNKRKFPLDEAMAHYKQQLISDYKTRKYMHFIVTPLFSAAYIYGFVMLLSAFEQELLGEFYTYIIYSAWVVFLGLAVLIGVQLKKELEILKSLMNDGKAS